MNLDSMMNQCKDIFRLFDNEKRVLFNEFVIATKLHDVEYDRGDIIIHNKELYIPEILTDCIRRDSTISVNTVRVLRGDIIAN